MGNRKSSSGQRAAKKLRQKLKAIWQENNFGPDMPIAISKLSRALAEKLGCPIVPGRKIAFQVIAFHGGKFHDPPKPTKTPTHKSPAKSAKEAFYASWDWRTLRMKIIKKHGPICMCCGATPQHLDMAGKPVKIVVDHIKPLHTHWHLRLDANNLQVLCDECNQGKGAWDDTDYRTPEAPDEWVIEDGIPDMLRDQLAIRH